MDVPYDEIKVALLDAEAFISGILAKESLSYAVEAQREQLAARLRGIKNRSTGHNDALPPRPPKGAAGAVKVEEEEEIYDDTIDVDTEDAPGYYTMNVEGVPQETNVDDEETKQGNYEVMGVEDNGKPEGDDLTYDVADIEEENYDEPGQDEGGDKSDVTMETLAVNQEVPSQPAIEEIEDNMYEGIEIEPMSTEADGKVPEPCIHRDRSVTHDMEDLTQPKKVSEVENVVLKGYLNKHRKKGIYIGSKWQKRYCVLRDYVMYYFKDDHADKQKGAIILPGYTPICSNKSKKEFSLIRENDRTYTFMTESQEETKKWVEAICTCAGAELSKRHSEILSDLRRKEHECDEDSMTYDDLAGNGAKISDNEDSSEASPDEPGEVYDDIASNKKLPEYEIPEVGGASSKEAPLPLADEFYEMAGDSDEEMPPAQPPRPSKPQTEPFGGQPADAFYETAESEPPRPPKPKPVAEEVYDLPGEDEEPGRLPGGTGQLELEEEETYELVDTEKPPPACPPTQDAEYEIAEVPPPRPGTQKQAPTPPPRHDLPEEPKPSVPVKPSLPQKPKQSQPLPPGGKPPLPPPTGDKIIGKAALPIPARENNIGKPALAPPPRDKEASQFQEGVGKAALPTPVEPPPGQVINYANIYQAKWDVKADNKDELEFSRGDLIYIYEKANSDWWIGSKYKPQGYAIKLVPSNYIMEAYNV